MFELIVKIVAIALGAFLLLAGLVWVGSNFLNSSAKAQASAFQSGASQIAAAWTLYEVENGSGFAGVVGDLVTSGDLQAVPTPPAAGNGAYTLVPGTSPVVDLVTLSLDTSASDVCLAIAKAGTGVTSIATAADANAARTALGNNVFSCFDAGSSVFTAYFKK